MHRIGLLAPGDARSMQGLRELLRDTHGKTAEWIVVVAVVALGGLIGFRALRDRTSDAVNEEGRRLVVLSGDESAAGTGGSANIVRPSPDPAGGDLRARFDEANRRTADTERAIDELDEQIRNARTRAERRDLLRRRVALYEELSRRRGEVDDAQRAILSDAYGGHYGFWQRNWIDVQNTHWFLLGMAERTPAGIAKAIVETAELLAWAHPAMVARRVVQPSPPRPPPPTADEEHARRMRERSRDLEEELARIRDPSGFNRRQGGVAGEEIIGPVVVGEAGVAAVTRLGTVARTGARGAEREAAATGAVPWQGGREIGRGEFSTVYQRGDHVYKVPNERVPHRDPNGGIPVRIPETDVAGRVELTRRLHNELAAALPPGAIPRVEIVPGTTTLRQPYIRGGLTPDELQGPALDRANRTIGELRERAEAELRARVGPSGELNGYRVRIDTNRQNFFFNERGELLGWFDPVVVQPQLPRL